MNDVLKCSECGSSLKQVGATGRGKDLVVFYECVECRGIEERLVPYGNESDDEKFKQRIRAGGYVELMPLYVLLTAEILWRLGLSIGIILLIVSAIGILMWTCWE